MQVGNNGILSFGTAISQYTPEAFPLGDRKRFIAPYWADVDTRLPSINPIIVPNGRSPEETGRIWYREEFQSELFERVARDVRRALVNHTNFYPTWLFIATWEAVGYFKQHIDRVSEGGISAMFSSNKVSQHNLLQRTGHADPAHVLHSFCIQTDHICHAQYSNYIAATHNITHSMHINMHSTPSTTHPTTFYNPPMHTTNNTNHSLQNGTRCRDGVKLLCTGA